jgi:uncharacterized protein (UPF0276 family)
LLKLLPDIGWLEVHSENYCGDGGQPRHYLERPRSHYPLSLHGGGLSLGSAHGLDRGQLQALARLVQRVEPALVSEHLSWGAVPGRHLNDLLPLPYTAATLTRVADHIDEVQGLLGRRMLLENPSSYLAFAESTMTETEFLGELVRRTGCGLLLDVNNVFVSATNLGYEPRAYVDAFPLEAVGEIHLGGHDEDKDEHGSPLLIDSHGREVADPVWTLYAHTLARGGIRPTLIEWDTDVPAWSVLRDEAARAAAVMETA